MAFLRGEKIFRPRMRERQRRIATAAKSGEIRNIMVLVPIKPTNKWFHY